MEGRVVFGVFRHCGSRSRGDGTVGGGKMVRKNKNSIVVLIRSIRALSVLICVFSYSSSVDR